jgi:hypothetical protein
MITKIIKLTIERSNNNLNYVAIEVDGVVSILISTTGIFRSASIDA